MKPAYHLPHTAYPVSCRLFPELISSDFQNIQSIFLTQGRKDFTQSAQRGYEVSGGAVPRCLWGAMSAGDADAMVRWDSCATKVDRYKIRFLKSFYIQEKKYEEKNYNLNIM